jgi:hypothetical protein
VYILEVNPRASRTVPFVSKAIGVPLAKIAARVMAGKTLAELGFTREIVPTHVSVKEAVFPFLKFPGVDTVLGPEMKSTGEVMGIGPSFGVAFAKAELAAGTVLPSAGTAFVSVRDEDREGAVAAARRLHELGFRIIATTGTAAALIRAGISGPIAGLAGSPRRRRARGGQHRARQQCFARTRRSSATRSRFGVPRSSARSRTSPPSRAPLPRPMRSRRWRGGRSA